MCTRCHGQSRYLVGEKEMQAAAHKGYLIAHNWPVQGMRGVVAFATEQDEQAREGAAAAHETWVAYPNDDPVRTVTSGADSRAALVPLLAHKVKLSE